MRGGFRAREAARAFTLVELQVASAIFIIVALVAFAVYSASRTSFKLGQNASDNQHRTRFAFLEVTEKVRLAGFDYNRDGDQTPYPDQTDEQIEYVHPRAITVRANYDFLDAEWGREPGLEMQPGETGFGSECCPIVTTGNDEILTYALRSEDSSANDDSIVLKLDAAPATGRDAVVDESGSIANEETLTITGVDLSGDNPPYTLVRFSLNSDGTGFDEAPLVDNIQGLRFRYYTASGEDWVCLDPQEDGSCPAGSEHPLANTLGGDDVGSSAGMGRQARGAIRHIDVELIGMNEDRDFKWRDPGALGGDPAEVKTVHHRKVRLFADIFPPNLGRMGQPDRSDVELAPPTNVTICGGQCSTVRVDWDKVSGAVAYKVDLYANTDPPEKVFTRMTPGIAVPSTNPPRVYAVYQETDDPDIAPGAELFARVISLTSRGSASEASDPSAVLTLTDVVRPGIPAELTASGFNPADAGYPDTTLISPVSDPGHPYYPKENQILLQWRPPHYALDVQDQSDPENSWDCRVNESTYPALACDTELAIDTDEDTVPDRERTQLRELYADIRYLIFRSTDPHFDPTDDDLIAEVEGAIDPNSGFVTYVDTTDHLYNSNDVWQETENAVPCCINYYYRVRAVDACWSGGSSASRTDPHLSPFEPLLNQGNVQDCDDTSALLGSEIGLAAPGYAIPTAEPGPPTELRFTEWDADAMTYRLQFQAPKRDTDTDETGQPDENESAYRSYRLYSHPWDPNYTLDASGGALYPATVDADITVRDLDALAVARDDEDGDGIFEDPEDETNNGVAGYTELVRSLADATPRYYRLVAYQCETDGIAGDEGDPTSYDFGAPSDPILFPCVFGGGASSWIDVDDSLWPANLAATMHPEHAGVSGIRARLILTNPATGDGVKSPAPGIDPTSVGADYFLFDAAHIDALLRDFPGTEYKKRVEILDNNGCYGFSQSSAGSNPAPCCIETGTPVAYITSGSSNKLARQDLTDTCGGELQITGIVVSLGNENGGQRERIAEVYWGETLLWQGASTRAEIDRRDDPLPLAGGATQTLWVQADKSVRGDSLTTYLVYSDGVAPDECEFLEASLQVQ